MKIEDIGAHKLLRALKNEQGLYYKTFVWKVHIIFMPNLKRTVQLFLIT